MKLAIIIDTSHLSSRIVHANKNEICRNPEYLSHVLFTSILMNARKFGASKENPIVLALDKKPYWRTKYYMENKDQFLEYRTNPKLANYKGNRVKDETIPWDKIYEVLDACLEAIAVHSDFHVVGTVGAEADDIIYIGSEYYSELGQEVDVVSSDKDFQQIHQPQRNIRVWDPIKKAFRPVIDIEHVRKLHAISGDGGDNIIPIKRGAGTGSKTAERIANDLDTYLRTDAELRERYEFNRTLTDLSRVPDYIRDAVISEMNKHEHSYNAMQLLKVFSKYRLNNIATRVNEFRLSDKSQKKPEVTKVYKTAEKIKDFHDNTLENFFG